MNPLIRKLNAIHPLTTAETDILASAHSKIVPVDAGSTIVREGDQPTNCNLLLEGWVSRYKVTADGKRQILSFQFPGDIFDAQSFVLEEMDHSIAAVTKCKVAVIPHETMREITEDYPRIARAIWRDTLADASVFREWEVNLGQRDAPQRIAHLFCEVFTRLKVAGIAKDHTIDWPITQVDLGDATGNSYVHVNRTLQLLRGSGLIALERKRLTILDWAGLQKMGQFEPRYLHLRPEARRQVAAATT